MNPRIYLLAALLVSPAWAQEPASFDLKSESIKKIVHEAASTQFADIQVADKAPVKTEPAAFKYVPPEKPATPLREPARKLPAKSSRPDGFVSAMFGILVDELVGAEDDGVTASNLILQCRVQKDIKSSPPGPDRCPSAN
jgi:hypothetical protein